MSLSKIYIYCGVMLVSIHSFFCIYYVVCARTIAAVSIFSSVRLCTRWIGLWDSRTGYISFSIHDVYTVPMYPTNWHTTFPPPHPKDTQPYQKGFHLLFVNFSINCYKILDNIKQIKFSKSFQGHLKMSWRALFCPRAVVWPPLF